MIYFDNASTTNFKPFSVKFEMFRNTLSCVNANPGRSGHKLSVKLGFRIFKARQTFKNFFNNDCEENVIFTSGCTEALNLAIFGTVKKGGHIITTINEHNSVLRPLKKLLNDNMVTVSFITPKNHSVTAEEIEKEIKAETYLVITNHTSNVTGATCNINKIGALCKKHKLLYLVDSAQSAGHIKIDMQKDNISMLAIAGHKGLHGPSGTGALIVNGNFKIRPLKFGGTGTESDNMNQPIERPEGLEAGTCAYVNILAFEKGARFSFKYFDEINKKISSLTRYLIDKLLTFDNIKILGDYKNNVSGVVSIKIKKLDPSIISSILNEKYKIYTRSGFFCAPLIHINYNTSNAGALRISLDFKNSKKEIDYFTDALSKILKTYN